MPWDSQSFRKHNRRLGARQAAHAAAVANEVLARTGDEGQAVRTANGVLRKERAMKYGAKPKPSDKSKKPMPFGAKKKK